ncbi:hypothetical protein V6N13_017066 [Hibiscus sabdariffa]|uniref:Uncharacterized protein n=1 Tax=Hibiscus sabdariffa TaxID=183260 RepID=A0ABR2CZW6_9ROSI
MKSNMMLPQFSNVAEQRMEFPGLPSDHCSYCLEKPMQRHKVNVQTTDPKLLIVHLLPSPVRKCVITLVTVFHPFRFSG